jgi:preprotein translocase subunit SecA
LEDEPADISDRVEEFVHECYAEKTENLGDAVMHELSTQIMLRVIDTRWMAYLQEMDYLKTGIGLRGFGQRDPLVEYKTEAYAAFSELVSTMYEDYLRTILRIEVVLNPVEEDSSALRGASYSGPAEVDGDQGRRSAPTATVKGGVGNVGPKTAKAAADKPRTYRKDLNDPYANVGRNDPCPCNSGKKFKNCHGRNR